MKTLKVSCKWNCSRERNEEMETKLNDLLNTFICVLRTRAILKRHEVDENVPPKGQIWKMIILVAL